MRSHSTVVVGRKSIARMSLVGVAVLVALAIASITASGCGGTQPRSQMPAQARSLSLNSARPGEATTVAQVTNGQSLHERVMAEQSRGTGMTAPSNLTVTTALTSIPPSGISPRKLVALTFDDGPGPYTEQVAQVLEKEKAVGTFFFIGRQIAKYPGIVSGLKAQGFELEDHTWDHVDLTKVSAARARLEISRTSEALGGAQYVRPPSGTYDATVLGLAHSLGLKLVLWNVDTLDWKYRSAASILARLRSEVRPGAIILMHDGGGDRSQTVAALPEVIEWLRGQGYTLVRVDQLGTNARPGTIK